MYVCMEMSVVIGTRTHFEVPNLYKQLLHRKCTIAAAYNLSVTTCATKDYVPWKILPVLDLV